MPKFDIPEDRTASADELESESLRRWLPLLALAALLLFAAVCGALAWRQYRDAQRAHLKDARAKALVAATVFDSIFRGQIGTLDAMSQAPVVVNGDTTAMRRYFLRVTKKNGQLFTGGLAWIDRHGTVRASTNATRPGPVTDVSDRAYFRQAIRSGQAFVSAGLTARRSHRHVLVIAVPTRDLRGETTGVLAGTLLVKPAKPDQRTIDLGYGGLAILDRQNQLVFSDFTHPRSRESIERFGRAESGILSDTRGLDGDPGHVVAYARSTVPHWTVILDRSRSEIFGDARRSLVTELLLIAGATLIGLALLAWILTRARTEARALGERARRRRLRYEEEHRVAMTLQRSLLSELPRIPGVDSAGRYQAGSTGLEVGGDWYDVVQRPDGIVHVSVGDVAGRGVAAAALMGQLRNAFRAYAYDHRSPAEIMWRLIRHLGEDEMATAICITIDPAAQRLAYSSAGHPPPLLRDDDSRATARLDLAQAPPLGFASPDAVIEAHVALPPRATLVAYTDGVIERRDRVIDEGIERLESALGSADPELAAGALADKLIHEVAEVTGADDDVALIVMRFLGTAMRAETDRPGDLAALGERPEA
jgi:serine phosphatase RsbU (regulator of sigma subunit)/acyl-CoA hydrolase